MCSVCSNIGETKKIGLFQLEPTLFPWTRNQKIRVAPVSGQVNFRHFMFKFDHLKNEEEMPCSFSVWKKTNVELMQK